MNQTDNIQPERKFHCAVCLHSGRERIESALLELPLREAERQFGINRGTLHRHRKDHMPAALGQARRAAGVRLALRGASVARRLQQLHSEAADLYAETRGIDYAAAVRALSIMQRQAEFAWRAAASVPAGGEMSESRFEALTQAVLRLLEPHPELRSQFAESIREIELRFAQEDMDEDSREAVSVEAMTA